jgi:hypothetical protein
MCPAVANCRANISSGTTQSCIWLAVHAVSPCASTDAPVDVAVVEEFGPALIVITGPGLVGLAWRWTAAAPPPDQPS